MKENILLDELEAHFESVLAVRNLAFKGDEELLKFLLDSKFKDEFKKRFFAEVCGNLVFKREYFLDFLDLQSRKLGFTKFSNKIGLGFLNATYLINQEKVVLNFPFKDCVLKGGQDKDDAKTKEIFFNEILAKSEIDVLLDPKVLQNFELVERERGVELKECLSEKANFLIKGNNLTVLHTLKKRRDIYGQVKLIYIDPPYNTDNDSFNYNDKFKHSTWLSFMKNRLEVAREFLREDGVIFIQCDDNEQAYLKVLCDEIFGRENFEITITCKVKSPSGLGSGVKPFFDCTEFILVYSKNKSRQNRFKILKEDVSIVCEANDKTTNNYNQVLKYINQENVESVIIDGVRLYKTKDFKIVSAEKNQKFYYENYEKIFRLSPSKFSAKLPQDNFIYFNENNFFYKNNDLAFLKLVSRIDNKSKKIYKQEWQSNLILGNMWQGLQNEGQVTLKNGKKPEALIKRIIEISTNENDLVMDFFAGSGTTLAVAMKMKRRFVGIEQMHYVESITKERLKKVVAGEQGGISKAIGWSGGGSFVYAELMPLNAIYKEKLINASDEKELEKLYKELESKAFVDYRADIQDIVNDREFHALALEEKKEVLYKILDTNMDYVPYGDIDDASYEISKELRELNRIFYKEDEYE